MSEKEKVRSLITYLYETMNGELALDYANLDSENIEILLDYIEKLENIIKEVRDILKKHICNPSGLKDGWHIDCWNNKDISKLNEDLGILEKGNKYDD